ncbi:MAG: hypothetical protein RIR62_2202, partial [Pseudomonadota bacterium]
TMALRSMTEFRLRALGAVALLALLLALPFAARAETAPPAPADALATAPAGTRALLEVLRMDEVLGVMRAEGEEYGRTIEADMFPGQGGAGWAVKVQTIYDVPHMIDRFGGAFGTAVGQNPAAMAKALDFFSSDLGQRILTLEIEARRALLDDAVEDAAKLAWADLAADEGPRAALLRDFAETNDLIESNVQGALNSNLAFFRGMAEGGALGPEVVEDEMLANVWSQEEEVRRQTEDWLFPYLALAYEPLSDADLEAYTAFSASPEGQVLNAALFAAYAVLFEEISFALGGAVAIQLQGQDI